MIRKATSVPQKKLSNTDASIRVNSPSNPNIRAKLGTSPFNGSGSDTNSSTNTNNNNTVTVTVHEKGMKPRRYVTCALGPSSSDEEDTTDFSSSENDSEVGDNNVLHDARSIDFGNTCLIDFGAVRQYHENNYYDIQSLWYRAPEVVCGVPYTNKIDSFSVGCVLFELYTGKPLFSGDSGLLQLTYVTQLLGLPSPASLSSGKYSSTMQPVFQQYMHSNQMQQQLNGNGGADHLQIFADWTRECRKIGEARYEKFCARQGKVVDEDFAVDAQEEQLFIQLLFQLLFPDEMGRIDCEKALQHHFFLYAGETEERHLFTSALYRSSPEATLGKKTEYTSNNGNHQRRATKPAHHTIHVKVPVQEVLHGMTPNQHSSTVEPVGNNCFVPIRVLQQPVNGGGTDRPEGSPAFFNQVPPLLHLPAVPFSPSSSPVNNHPYLPASPQQHSPSMEMYYLSGSNNNNNNNNMNNNHNHNHNHHFNGSSYVGSPHSCRTPQFLPLTTISSLRDSPEMVALNNDNRNTNNNNNNNSNSNKMQFHLYNENQPHPQNGSILSYQQQNNNTLAEPHPLLAEQNKVLLQLMTPTNLILTTGNNNYNHNNNNNNNNQNFIVSPNHYYNTTNYGFGEANYHAGAPPFFAGMKESNNNNNNNNGQFHYNPQQNNNNNHNNNMNMQNFTVLPECY
ncbi:Protein kinase domain containing protein, putative [Angomonas deanei]|uniref:Protein kinase domain containing protein, putative n=1 Tax=Angomonas deanei TaxID=59799 RepID=A0A7G2BZL1_9TRYP|nr:Protein kinase domain containing protein, putative [Angomonas deanei]